MNLLPSFFARPRMLFPLLTSMLFAASSFAGEPSGKPVVFALAGDSTVAKSTGWGDAFLAQLKPGVVGVNLALPGRSSKSFRDEGHWNKVFASKAKYVLIQFGHNDNPSKGPERSTDPKTSFRDNLKRYVSEVRAYGGTPVLVTSVTRRNFSGVKLVDPHLAPYVEATRAVAAETRVPLVDLNARSIELVEHLGPEKSLAFSPDLKGKPGQKDFTHLTPLGGKAMASLVIKELGGAVPETAGLFKPADAR